MLKGGTIIRLIDVVLIILLGFLGITDFEIKSQVKLPSTSSSAEKKISQQIVFLSIKDNNSFEIIEDQKTIPDISDLGKLENCLVRLNNYYLQNNNQMIVVIEPNVNSYIQTTVSIMDICERHNISKNLSYDKVELE